MPGQYNPESILQEQFESQRQSIQKHFQTQWDEVNNKARAGLFKSQKERDGAFFEIRTEAIQTLDKFTQKVKQAVGEFQQIDKLAEMRAIKDPDEVKWRMVLGPEAEKAMFQQQADPHAEHPRNLAEQNRLMDIRASFVIDNGRLYEAKTKKVGNTLKLIDEADKDKPATQEQIRTWAMAEPALAALIQEEQEIIGQLSGSGVPDPAYLQSLATGERRKGFFKKWLQETGFRMRGGTLKELKRKRKSDTFATEPSGTFAQKVQQGIVKPQPRQPSAQATPKAIRQRNKRTGQERISYDGGKTWQMSG